MQDIDSWFSPKVYIGSSPIAGKGLYCKESIAKDEVVAIKGGHTVDAATFALLPDSCKRAALQIAETVFLAPITEEEIPRVMNYVNHACEPNVGLKHTATVAMRDIKPGEELTGDYAIAYSDGAFFAFMCQCDTTLCRGRVTNMDWQLPELQARYAGYFGQYIQEKIDRMQRQ